MRNILVLHMKELARSRGQRFKRSCRFDHPRDQSAFTISPVGVLDTDGPLLLLLNVSLPDADEQRHQEEEPQHTGADLHDLHVADDGRNLEESDRSGLGGPLGASAGGPGGCGPPGAAGRSGRYHRRLYRRSLRDTGWRNTRPPRCGTCKTCVRPRESCCCHGYGCCCSIVHSFDHNKKVRLCGKTAFVSGVLGGI